ncbi:hypothetical protein ABWL39_04905 [Chitinivorax sp. PXF-14]|uniref:hypothetical protein n=1 Tax=Chitinivorax sp. PXF-14 TaxID=3230488 RepID=UPI00346790F1
MNIPQFPSDVEGRRRWPKIAAAVWLLFASVLAVVNSVGLSHLAEQSRTNAQDTHVQALVTRVGEVEQQVEEIKRQPKPIPQTDFDTARQALEERLAHVEQAQATDAHGDDIKALQARVGVLEARLKKAAPSAADPHKTAEAAKPKVPEPPFNVVGLELRGGERFVSIASRGAAALTELRLLRVGESIGAWQLQAIDAHAAVFRVDDQIVRVALP